MVQGLVISSLVLQQKVITEDRRVRAKSRSDIERQYKRIINDPSMYKERYDRVTDARSRYLSNIYRTRRSQSDRKRIRGLLREGGDNLDKAMTDIMARKYERTTYMYGQSNG